MAGNEESRIEKQFINVSLLLTGMPYLFLFISFNVISYFNFINPYWQPKPTDIEHVTYAYISSKDRPSHHTIKFMKETINCT
jgi:hypothetical protein